MRRRVSASLRNGVVVVILVRGSDNIGRGRRYAVTDHRLGTHYGDFWLTTTASKTEHASYEYMYTVITRKRMHTYT